MVLQGISPHTTFYSTSPVRTAGIFSTTAFVSQPRIYSARQNAAQWLGAPNAALLSGSQGPYLADSVGHPPFFQNIMDLVKCSACMGM